MKMGKRERKKKGGGKNKEKKPKTKTPVTQVHTDCANQHGNMEVQWTAGVIRTNPTQ